MNNLLTLPQVQFLFKNELPRSQILLVAGGRPPSKEWLTIAAATYPIWAVDRGIDICQASNVIPLLLIGDGDSATPEGWTWGTTLGIPVEIHPPEKDLTDLQLALQKLGLLYDQAAVVVTGVWGGRFDHSFSNIFSLLGCGQFGISGYCAADESEVLVLLKGHDSVKIHAPCKPDVVSLLPLSPYCSGVFIDGVHWPLSAVELTIGLPYSISNRPTKNPTDITVSVEKGCLGIYMCWEQNCFKK
ncbi:MAG: thiamine pyrophosphokinase [Firmicutes bacterium]|nr:thiamine pyrophosphokinase [Bacillota bacterium]